MSQLSFYDPEILSLLISVPYRIGIWVSHAEDEDGETDDELEITALENCIREVAKAHDQSGLVNEVGARILSERTQWEDWAGNAFLVLKDCDLVVRALKAHAPADEFKDYKAFLMEIATSVAQAYGEFGLFEEEKKEGGMAGLMKKIVGGFSGLSKANANHPMNVSPAEESVIAELKALLDSIE